MNVQKKLGMLIGTALKDNFQFSTTHLEYLQIKRCVNRGKIMRKAVVLFILTILMVTTADALLEPYNPEIIVQNHTAVMLIVDASTGEFVGANLAAEKFYGYSVDELKRMNISQINMLSKDEIKTEMDLALLQKRDYFIFQHKLKDGTIRDVEVYSSPATGEQGNQILFSIVHDITAKTLAEKQLSKNIIIIISLVGALIVFLIAMILHTNKMKAKEQEMKLRFQRLFDNMQEGFALHEIICDEKNRPVDYRFLEVNSAFETITGLKAAYIKNKTVKEVLPNTEQYWIEQYGEVALKNKSFSFENYSSDLEKHFNVSVYSPRQNQFSTMFTDVTEQAQSKEKIEMERKLLETILEDSLSGYWDWDLVHNQEYLSPSFKMMFGYENHELENSPEAWQRIIFKEDLSTVLDCFWQHVDSHGEIPFNNEVRYHHKNGSVVYVICSGRVVEWEENKPIRMVGCHINITNMKTIEKQLKQEHNRFKTTLHSLGDAVISTDKDGKVDLMNAVAERLTGWTNVEAKGTAFETVFHIINEITRVKCDSPVKKVLDTGEIIELANHTLLIKKNGDEIPIEDSAAPIKDESGNIIGVVLVFRDFTEKKEKQKTIHYLSHHDQLTGLYNRYFFEEQLHKLDTQNNLPFSIAMADVNGLKLTNDAFGHNAGDELLKKVAQILKRECRLNDIVARVGGDEFVMLFPKTTNNDAKRIISCIKEAIREEKQGNIITSVSIGWETKENSNQSISDIFGKAEENMYRKKLNESQSMRNQTIKVIMQTLQETNPREKVHSEKVGQLSSLIGQVMKLDSETLKELETAGLMHDIGKIAINENLLNKAGKLTDNEYEEVKRHPEIGYHILRSVDSYTNLADHVLSHHERWDGTGYPRELLGEGIPLVARIIAVADSFEAMTGERPYRETLSIDQAIEEIKRCSGTQFDPNIVDTIIQHGLIKRV